MQAIGNGYNEFCNLITTVVFFLHLPETLFYTRSVYLAQDHLNTAHPPGNSVVVGPFGPFCCEKLAVHTAIVTREKAKKRRRRRRKEDTEEVGHGWSIVGGQFNIIPFGWIHPEQAQRGLVQQTQVGTGPRKDESDSWGTVEGTLLRSSAQTRKCWAKFVVTHAELQTQNSERGVNVQATTSLEDDIIRLWSHISVTLLRSATIA
jgi:hypothetical protein